MEAPNWKQVFYVNFSLGEDSIDTLLLQRAKGSQCMHPIYCASRVKLVVVEMTLLEIDFVMVSVVFAF